MAARVFVYLAALTIFIVSAASRAGSIIEVEGILVVTECRGADYRQISMGDSDTATIEKAAGCARMGAPVAIFVQHGNDVRLYKLASPAKNLAGYIAQHARLTGPEIAPQVVLPDKLEIRTRSGWIEVATTSVM